METFPVAFKAGNLELDAIVTAFDHRRRFKVEMVTNERNPIILQRLAPGEWNIENRGERTIQDKGFQELEKAIDDHLHQIYTLKNILVLTDFSDAAVNAARYAAAFAARIEARNMIIYHSTSLPIVTDVPFGTSSRATDDQEEIKIKLDRLKDEMSSLVSSEITISTRRDERVLISAVNILAEQLRLGLVAMGTTGRSNLKEILVGSNTTTIARESRIPVLIVPAGAQFEEIERVVFACDLKKVSETTPVEAIKTVIATLRAKLLILNVGDDQNFDPDMIKELTDLHRLWDDEQPEYHYIQHEDLVTGIMDFATRQKAQLVITVPKQYGFFEGLFHRGLTKRLAYHTHLPLLLFKENK
jgi:nucleotide-binding universal stress UspA family protein